MSEDERAKVSIGIPVHNGEELLPETIDSVLAQTFEDFRS
jgi:glycosyltransferase involved in cell wall biosynthesis